jgi:D-alanyl-D-alanine carboxypeptidase (penicillin-binding protein 5/6)
MAEVGIRDRDVAVALAPAEQIRITVRKGQQVDTRVSAPDDVDGPVTRGEQLGDVVVSVDGEAVDGAPLVAVSSASAAGLVERYDAAVPGPRLVAWALVVAALALAVVLLRGWLSRRR